MDNHFTLLEGLMLEIKKKLNKDDFLKLEELLFEDQKPASINNNLNLPKKLPLSMVVYFDDFIFKYTPDLIALALLKNAF